MIKDKKQSHTNQVSHGGVSGSSDLSLLQKHQYLAFKLYCRSNNLTWEKEVSKRQFILLKIIRILKSKGLGYRKIANWLNDSGIKTHTNKKFTNSHVRGILKRFSERDERYQQIRHKKYKSRLFKKKFIFK